MKFFYSLGIEMYFIIIKLLKLFHHTKATEFITGRVNVWNDLKAFICKTPPHTKKIWCHVSSLGEFEQAKPVLLQLRQAHPDIIIYVSFFSPSGMKNARTENVCDYKFYLPKDSSHNAQKLVNILHPDITIFVKYDLWHYYIQALKNEQIPILLISAHFRPNHIYFKPWGGFYRDILKNLTHIFVQKNESIQLLSGINISNVTITGDTRVDAVLDNLQSIHDVSWIKNFKNPEKKLMIIGSAWQKDWQEIRYIYPQIQDQYQLIIASHDISPDTIQNIENDFAGFNICKQSLENYNSEADILIIDSIGWLKHIYQYTQIAWIGGGFKSSGIHNILEPAVYGNAIFFGPNYKKFPEAFELIELKGAYSTEKAKNILHIIQDQHQILMMGKVNQDYIRSQAGASLKVYNFIKKYL